MTKITNISKARVVLLPSFILSAGQSRDATEPELAKMNKRVLLGLISDGKLTAPDIETAMSNGLTADDADAHDKQAAIDAAARAAEATATAAREQAEAVAAQNAADREKAQADAAKVAKDAADAAAANAAKKTSMPSPKK